MAVPSPGNSLLHIPRMLAIGLLAILSLSACSPRQMVIDGVANELASQGHAPEEDLELAREASAFYLKLAESLLRSSPDNYPLAESVTAGFLLVIGGYLRRSGISVAKVDAGGTANQLRSALWVAKWELFAPVVAIASLVSGLATPTESAALTAAYAILTQSLAHRELDAKLLGRALADCAQIIGGVMLILGMALGLTNFLVDAGIPDAAIEWVQSVIPNKFVFLLALTAFLLVAGALMEIFAAIVVLVPLLLPVALSYGIDPVHFGIIFLAAMEMGFLCPPAGMNIYFASAMFGKPIRYVAASILPAVLAIFLGTLLIAWIPPLATGLPALLAP